MKLIKENYKFLLVIIGLILLFNIHFPYYIDAPGGISDVSSKIEIDGYKSEGTFNLAYVKEYRATIPTLLISLFNKDWKVLKQEEILLDTEDDNSYLLRDKILMKESISNAINVAYSYANKNLEIISNEITITYISEYSDTNLVVGDIVTYINENKISSKKEIENIINNSNVGDKLEIKVINNNKEYYRYAYVVEEENVKKVGILLSEVREYQTKPSVKINTDSNESGSSGGLITALSIYDSLTEKDITNGLTIVGTGTIDLEGNIGSIGGVEYKLKSAVKENADLFIVPNDENYKEAIKLKKENNYDIEIVGVSTFEEVISYLNSIANK
ncbi:MAG: hypothetical protein IJY25_02400 [Bacilli bacterium]|nr:hypothetical protein [Bacilli bacterium]